MIIIMKRKLTILNIIVSLLLLIWFLIDCIINKHPNSIIIGLFSISTIISIFTNKIK